MKHLDVTTHIQFPFDQDILTRKLFDVNMRLFESSESYKAIILQICEHLKWCCNTEKEGYKKPHGFSGANGGIPFNIIVVQRNGEPVIMINPKITKAYGKDIQSLSNCGSITYEKPIEIWRKEFIDLTYFNEKGEFVEENKVSRREGSLTAQHEVDHNLGILIFQRKEKSINL